MEPVFSEKFLINLKNEIIAIISYGCVGFEQGGDSDLTIKECSPAIL